MVKFSEVRYADKQKARRVQRRLQLLEANTVDELFDKAMVLKDDGDVNVLDTKKAQNLNTERLQLPWDITSDSELSKRDIKTEKDLSQYRSTNDEQEEGNQSNSNNEVEADESVADNKVIRYNQSPEQASIGWVRFFQPQRGEEKLPLL